MYNIRLATEDDVELIVALARCFYSETDYAARIPFDDDDANVMALKVLDEGYCLLAEVDGLVVGGLGCMVGPFPMNGAYNISTEIFWYVHPAHRNGHLAAGLVEQAELLAIHDGCVLITMAALNTSPKGISKFYEHRGYVENERTYVKGI